MKVTSVSSLPVDNFRHFLRDFFLPALKAERIAGSSIPVDSALQEDILFTFPDPHKGRLYSLFRQDKYLCGLVTDVESLHLVIFHFAQQPAEAAADLGLSAIGIFNMRGRKKQVITFLNDIPMLNPDIITGISLFLLFVSMGISQGYTTVVLAHIAFCTPYVVLSVMPRLQQMNSNIYEAALDLGATPFQALRKIIIPEIRPGMVSGMILAFTLSIDDFAVTLFTKGNEGLETLSTYIYADARKGGLTPELRPLSTIIFVVVLLLLIVINVRAKRNAKRKQAM